MLRAEGLAWLGSYLSCPLSQSPIWKPWAGWRELASGVNPQGLSLGIGDRVTSALGPRFPVADSHLITTCVWVFVSHFLNISLEKDSKMGCFLSP